MNRNYSGVQDGKNIEVGAAVREKNGAMVNRL
jgi:hypothetical protein